MKWNTMETAPRDGTHFLAKIEWEETPVVVWWPEGRKLPSVDSTGLWAYGEDWASIEQEMDLVFLGWLPLPEWVSP